MQQDELKKFLDVVAQFLRRDRGVLHKRKGLGVAFHGHGKAKGGFAQAPDARLPRQVERVMKAVTQTARAQVLLDRLEPRRQVFLPIAINLNAEQSAWLAFDEALA